ncbi:zinc finger MYM-type protein 1-like [Stegodyphus dumicola]|uniref:zinc finger MYM-type protein 1-like n=1 Tax=Stegodyphus dumicola TaxID=202533 RepID=UPI0015AC240D|nr:zinc finger MYM-type protein 1-like [Stegodyphus dumicola]
MYEKFKWLIGCSELNKLYCWPCLLFVVIEKDKNIWTKQGYSDLNPLHEAAKKHEKTQSHINAVILLKTFGTARIDLMLDQQKASSIVQHNEKVTRNKNILKRLIDVVCYLAKQEDAFCGHNENITSLNRGNYIEFITLISKYDDLLATHLRTANVFSGTSNRIQNDIIALIKNIVISEIRNEVKETPFVAIMLDETSDISHKSQLSVVLRYVNNCSAPVERFLFFKNVSGDRSAEALCNVVQETILSWGCENKLIAQMYDGVAVMAGALNWTQKKVKDIFPEAMFVHCCAHILNLVPSQSVLFIKDCKLFFATISGITSFFSLSTKRNHVLNEIIKRKFPKLATTR